MGVVCVVGNLTRGVECSRDGMFRNRNRNRTFVKCELLLDRRESVMMKLLFSFSDK
jgi:hypothetical protein